MNVIKLLCIPYAGGSTEVYRKWKNGLDKNLELELIELAGRGRRYDDKFYDNLNNAADDIFTQLIKKQIFRFPYAVFGHSMGSIIAYELCHKIQKECYDPPAHIFFSGHGAPNIKDNEEEVIHQLPDSEFKEKLKTFGGTPDEILNDDASLSYFLPIIRADYKIIENYNYLNKQQKLKSNISILNGNTDEVNILGLSEWKNHTDGQCNIYNFPGGHFFINNCMNSVIKLINITLLQKDFYMLNNNFLDKINLYNIQG